MKDLFHKDDVPTGKDMSQVHAVCLDGARGAIFMNVTATTKVGTEKNH